MYDEPQNTEPQNTNPPTPQETPSPPDPRLRTIGILVASTLSVIGLVMQFQSVNLLTGAGVLWIGAALAAGGFVAAFVMKVPVWMKVVTALVLVACVVNVVYVEHQLNQKRQEIQQIIDSWPK